MMVSLYLQYIQKHHTNNTRNHFKPALKNWKIQTYSNELFFFCNHPFSSPQAEHIIVSRPNSERGMSSQFPHFSSLCLPCSLENNFLLEAEWAEPLLPSSDFDVTFCPWQQFHNQVRSDYLFRPECETMLPKHMDKNLKLLFYYSVRRNQRAEPAVSTTP